MIENNEYISVPQLARLLGMSRVAVFKKVRAGEIKATRIGRNYAINMKEASYILGKELSKESKQEIEKAVATTVAEYSEVLRLLAKE